MPRTPKISIIEIIADSSLTGAPRHLLTLLSGINRRKFIVSVIAPEGPLTKQLKALKVPVFTVPMQGRSDLPAIAAIKKIVAKYEPDIVHTHGHRAGMIGRLATRFLPVTRLHTEHSYTGDSQPGGSLQQWSRLRAKQLLGSFTHHTIAVSDGLKTFLTTSQIAKPSKVTTIFNGIAPLKKKPTTTQVKQFRASHDISARDNLIGTVGTFNKQKDTHTLIRAFAQIVKKHPATKLMLIGTGELERDLKQLVEKLGIADRVIFTGFMQDITTALHAMQLFVLPSKSEAFGISILEAMQAGVPVIASKVGGIPEIITHNLSGLLVEHGDTKKLAAAMSKLINDKQLQKKITSHYPQILKKFSAANMVKQTESLFTNLADR